MLSGGGHSGTINTTRYAQRLTGVDQVHAAIDGFHLTGPLFEPIIKPTVAAFEPLESDWLVPTHCTGCRAMHAIAARMPDQCIQDAVGTTCTFTAADAGG